MTAGGYKYLWQDNHKYVTPTSLPAAQYVENLMDWAEMQINDETLFPIQPGMTFQRDFRKRVSIIFRRFFRVYAHIYHHHIQHIQNLGAEAHLNSCFKHFIYFVLEFQLMEIKE
uniref:MOB kinase activator 3A n=1 Tax=Lygus hesperus TaxID=30085 RepID=A0A0A9VWZ0_LYGHE